MLMSREDVIRKIAEITSKEFEHVENERSSSSSDSDNNEEKIVDDACEVRSNSAESTAQVTTSSTATSLNDLQKIFGGIIVNKYLMDTRQMTRKEYLQYSKGLKQSDVLDHPLMYSMFRSEDQSQVNFLEWIDRFKK